MGLIITSSDFKGKFKISQNNYDKKEVEEYIDTYESRYLEDLLGCELSELFIADLVDGVPQEQRFLDIYNPFCDDDLTSFSYYGVYRYWSDICDFTRSEGMKFMLTAFVYWEYVRDQHARNTVTGTVKNTYSNSNALGFDGFQIENRYNLGIETYSAIQRKICKESATYPEFNGRFKGLSIPL